MLIGRGDIANVLPDSDNLLFFASGVSNSQETRIAEFMREIDLLRTQDRTKHLVYFSSLCIFYSDTIYAKHKKYMEKMVKDLFPSYTIIRIGNITWGENPNTLINALVNRLNAGQEVVIKDDFRYIVEKDEFLHWIKIIPKWNCEMNIPGRTMKVAQVMKKYVYPRVENNYDNA